MNNNTFDFDEWAVLANSAPDVFEHRRRESIEQVISDSANIYLMRGLQCHIDMERIRAGSKLKACIQSFSLMCESLMALKAAVNIISRLDEEE